MGQSDIVTHQTNILNKSLFTLREALYHQLDFLPHNAQSRQHHVNSKKMRLPKKWVGKMFFDQMTRNELYLFEEDVFSVEEDANFDAGGNDLAEVVGQRPDVALQRKVFRHWDVLRTLKNVGT